MDALLALMEEEPPEESGSKDRALRKKDLPTSNTSSRGINTFADSGRQTLNGAAELGNNLSLSVDAKVGIRMIERKISGADLLDLLSTNPYHSTASLSAMSLSALNQLLSDPAAVIDAATVSGRTNLITVGIVFSNSGTRVGASGNAFCALTIGNLNTGPAVSVLLFGRAYSQLCRTCQPGKIVALLNPKLIPPKEDSSTYPRETSVSFSVSEERQLLLVANSRDYGLCKALTRGKNRDGQWVNNAKQCNHFIDKRVSDYCDDHRKMQNMKSEQAKGAKMQQLRVDSAVYAKEQAKVLTFPKCSVLQNLKQQHYSRKSLPQLDTSSVDALFDMPALHRNSHSCTDRRLDLPISRPNVMTRNPPFSRSASLSSSFSNQRCSLQVRPSGQTLPACEQNTTVRLSKLSAQRHFRQQEKRDQLLGKSQGVSCVNSEPLLPNLLDKTGHDRKNRKKIARGRKVNTDVGGFDGKVAVPKESKLFSGERKASESLQARMFLPQYHSNVDSGINGEKEILSRQREMAERIKESKASTKDKKSIGGNPAQRPAKVVDVGSKSCTTLAEILREINSDDTVRARSRFAEEVAAEEYALSRTRVVDLERQEAKQCASARVKKDAAPLSKEWYCFSCNRAFLERPTQCHLAGHTLKLRRSLREKNTTTERRLTLSNMSEEDGGLKLGTGLEWSRRRRLC